MFGAQQPSLTFAGGVCGFQNDEFQLCAESIPLQTQENDQMNILNSEKPYGLYLTVDLLKSLINKYKLGMHDTFSDILVYNINNKSRPIN